MTSSTPYSFKYKRRLKQLMNYPFRLQPTKAMIQANKKNGKGETALLRACVQNKPDKVAQLLRTPGIDPNTPDNYGWTPLGEACFKGNTECVRELLKLPAVPPSKKQLFCVLFLTEELEGSTLLLFFSF